MAKNIPQFADRPYAGTYTKTESKYLVIQNCKTHGVADFGSGCALLHDSSHNCDYRFATRRVDIKNNMSNFRLHDYNKLDITQHKPPQNNSS